MNKCEFWEYLSVSYDENCFGKSRKCCWCRIWLYWLYCTLYMEVVLLMKILRFLNLKWINFGLTCPPLLCLSSPLAKTSEDNCWWNFWRNATKCEFWLMVRNRTLTAMKYLVRGWTRMKIWRSGVDGTGDLMMNLFWLWFWWLSKTWWCVMIWWSRRCGREMRRGLFK